MTAAAATRDEGALGGTSSPAHELRRPPPSACTRYSDQYNRAKV